MSTAQIGPAKNRVDGPLKITGAAQYSVEFLVPKCAYGWTVESTIAKGRITSIDTTAAQAAPGVLTVLTHLNAPKYDEPKTNPAGPRTEGIRSEERLPLKDETIHYAGQYVALIVAKSLEEARHAAALVQVQYAPEPFALRNEDPQVKVDKPEKNMGDNLQASKGNLEAAWSDPHLIKIKQTYTTPTQTHNPIEMSGTIAVWENDFKLTVYDATQYVKGAQGLLARINGLHPDNVHVICPFVGGAFGCKGALWPHVQLAVMGAKMARVPVLLHVTRRNMFVGTGHRTPTQQTISLAATAEGKLRAIQHVTETQTSPVGHYIEACGVRSSGSMYASPAIHIDESIHTVNIATPTFMRAPGECPGTYALECAMDELAVALRLDPVKLRLANYADNHPLKDVPFSAKSLREAYTLGAEKFGWGRRNPAPRSMQDGDWLVGWGMATSTYPAHKMSAAAKVQLRADGTATVQCATHDLGTGAYTAFTQISSEQLGIPFEKIRFELGDSSLPFGPVAGGSNSTGTVGTALHEVASLLHEALAELAIKDRQSPLFQKKPDEIHLVAPGLIGLKDSPATTDSFTKILQRANRESIEVESQRKDLPENKKQAFQSWGAVFCEVKVDSLFPRVQVTRVTSVINCGRVVTAKPARSQILGGIIMGLGMALMEETVYDKATGLPVTRNLADYHIPTNLDAPDIDVHFIGEPDFDFNPIGARGIGEIGNTGIAAAVANAVYHATGKRVRDLPITLDKLL